MFGSDWSLRAFKVFKPILPSAEIEQFLKISKERLNYFIRTVKKNLPSEIKLSIIKITVLWRLSKINPRETY